MWGAKMALESENFTWVYFQYLPGKSFQGPGSFASLTLSFSFLEGKTDSEKGVWGEKEEEEEEEKQKKQAASKPRLKQAGCAVQNGFFVTNYSSFTEYCLSGCSMLSEWCLNPHSSCSYKPFLVMKKLKQEREKVAQPGANSLRR